MRGRRHHRSVTASVLCLPALALGFDTAADDCTCKDADIERAIREADRILIGTPVSAKLEEDAVRFVVKVDDNLRGPPQDELELTTPRPGDCGVAIHLGMPELFVLRSGEKSVAMCSGSGAGDPFMGGEPYDDLAFAVTLVSRAEIDAAKALELVEKERWRFSNRELAGPLFELIAKLDRHGFAVTLDPDFILYRGIELRYIGGKLETARAAAR